MHIIDTAVTLAIIESPVRADSLASVAPGLMSVAAVGGITMAYEGKSNPNNPSDFLPRLSPDVISTLGGVDGRTAVFIPDSDHRTNPACNQAAQQTVETLLEAGAAWAGVVDVPDTITHPRSGRVVSLGDGAGLDDYAAKRDEMMPGTQWLGPLLANAIEGTEYIAQFPAFENDVQGLAEVVADRLARDGRYKYIATGRADGVWHRFNGQRWGIDIAEAGATGLLHDRAFSARFRAREAWGGEGTDDPARAATEGCTRGVLDAPPCAHRFIAVEGPGQHRAARRAAVPDDTGIRCHEPEHLQQPHVEASAGEGRSADDPPQRLPRAQASLRFGAPGRGRINPGGGRILGSQRNRLTLRTYTHLMPTSEDRTRQTIANAFRATTSVCMNFASSDTSEPAHPS